MALSTGAVRVVHLADFGSAYPGSFVGSLVAIRRAVEARGWTFEASFAEGAEGRQWYDELRRAGMAVRIAPDMSRRERAAWVRALLAERTGVTILHTHFAYWDLPAVLAARRQPARMPIVWHRHGPLSAKLGPRARQSARFAIAGRAIDAHLCVGQGVYADTLARFSPADRTRLFPNAVDLERFAPVDEHERARARAALELRPGDDVLVTFVWDWNRKGGELILRALHELRARGREAALLMIGQSSDAQPLVDQLELGRAVRVIGPQDDPRSLYYAADLFVSASLGEGMPYALLEALACGTPVVASDIPEHRALAEHLPACRLAQQTPGELASAIAHELEVARTERDERLALGRAYLMANAGLDAWAERLCELDEQLLAGRRNGAGHA